MMHIKIATKENIGDIAKIEQACFSAPWSEDSIAESLDNPASHFLIAYYGDEVAGYMGLQIFSGEGYVTNVAVLPKFRGKGIAKELLRRLEADARINGFRYMVLETGAVLKDAIGLYTKSGYKEIPNYGPYADMPQSICMRKKL